jgi:hypothetical protein
VSTTRNTATDHQPGVTATWHEFTVLEGDANEPERQATGRTFTLPLGAQAGQAAWHRLTLRVSTELFGHDRAMLAQVSDTDATGATRQLWRERARRDGERRLSVVVSHRQVCKL